MRARHDRGSSSSPVRHAYSGAQWLTFGTLEPRDLVPGQKPYGLIPTRTQSLPDPYGMTDSERQRFYEALRQPIRVGLWWQGGEEFLELQPADIDYVGFP